ncbi:MAG TPA: hypothetical protein VJ728_13555 [Candidatus Binataceae bacterium]|nr:hypothetical protein [Candidatus Binataceae bacterium]
MIIKRDASAILSGQQTSYCFERNVGAMLLPESARSQAIAPLRRSLMDKWKITGAVLATAVGVLFTAQPLLAENSQASQAAHVKCVGGNSCKGQSECASKVNSCKGQNSCKGKGWITTSSTQQCEQRGGRPENS